jgi:hypothetical protein
VLAGIERSSRFGSAMFALTGGEPRRQDADQENAAPAESVAGVKRRQPARCLLFILSTQYWPPGRFG